MKKYIAISSLFAVAAIASADPTPTIDMGMIGDTTGVYMTPDASTGTMALGAGQILWVKFQLGEAIAGSKFLDIYSMPFVGQTTGFIDTEIGLYNSIGNFIATDDDFGVGLYSMLTHGDPGPRGPMTYGTLGAALPADGFDPDLAAGTYWLAVGGFDSTFGATNWGAASTSSVVGDLRVNFHTNAVPEPATMAILGLGALAAVARRRRK